MYNNRYVCKYVYTADELVNFRRIWVDCCKVCSMTFHSIHLNEWIHDVTRQAVTTVLFRASVIQILGDSFLLVYYHYYYFIIGLVGDILENNRYMFLLYVSLLPPCVHLSCTLKIHIGSKYIYSVFVGVRCYQ